MADISTVTVGSTQYNIKDNAAARLAGPFSTINCRDDANANGNKELGNSFRNGTSGADPGKVRFFSVYGANTSIAPTTYGEVLEFTHYNSNHYQPQLWFGAGKSGYLYHRNKEYNSDTGGAGHTILDSNNYTSYTVKKDGTGASGTGGISISGNAATATKLGTSNVGSSRQAIYLSGGSPVGGNYTVAHFGNAGKSNMNDVGRLHSSTGMTNLSDPGNTTDNPMNGTTKATGGTLYGSTNYSDDPSGSNAGVAQIANTAGSNKWGVRSRSGSTITNGTAGNAPGEHLVVAPQSGQGGTTTPIYVDANGHTAACSYTIEKSVPSNAVFTDTNTWRGIQDNLTSSTNTTESLSAKQGYLLANGSARDSTKLPISDLGLTTIKVTRGTSQSTSVSGYGSAMVNSTQTGSPTCPVSGKGWHVISMDGSGTDTKNGISQLAIATQDGNGVWGRRNNSSGTEINSSTGHRLAEGDSDGNVPWANVTGKPSTYAPSSHGHGVNTTTVAAASVDGSKLVLTNTTVATSVKNS